jgi:hypothetical protein
MTVRTGAACLLAVGLLWPRQATGQEVMGDATAATVEYDLDNPEWNGLSTLHALAEGLGIDIARSEELDWDALHPTDCLWLLSPTRRVDIGQMTQFLQGGGTLVVGDDFGTGEELLARLGFLRRAAGGNTVNYQELSFARIAKPVSIHPLAESVDELVTNHAAVINVVPGYDVVFAFRPDQALVAVGPVGRGTLVVLADPSVLINRMLEFKGNLQFAENLLGFSTRAVPERRIHVVTGDVVFRGEVRNLTEAPTAVEKVRVFLTGFNHFLEELNDYVLTNAGIYLVAGLLIAALALFTFSALPMRQRTAADARFWQTPIATAADSREIALAAIAHKGKRADFAAPALALRHAVDSAIGRALSVEHPLQTFTLAELGGVLQRDFGADAARALRRLGPFLDRAGDQAVTWDQFSRGKREVDDFLRAIER